MNKLIELAARILLAQIFIISGFGKITGYAGTQQYMASMGVPGILLPVVILTELGGGIALLLGFKTRWVAFALAGFTVLSALIFHRDFGNQMQMINFMKNLAMAGGLLLLVEHGASPPAIDQSGRR